MHRHGSSPYSFHGRRLSQLIAIAAAATTRNCDAFSPPQRAAPKQPRWRPVIHTQIAQQGRTDSLILYTAASDDAFQKARLTEQLKSSQHQSTGEISSTVEDSTEDKTATENIAQYLKQLFLLCRPINFPIVIMFHVLGIHQAVSLYKTASRLTTQQPLLLPLMMQPSMLVVLIALLLVTSTSMITNDYYDARYGVDTVDTSTAEGNSKPIARGDLPFSITKTFDSYLYAILLLLTSFIPGKFARLMVSGGAIITYLYTVHLKPRPYIKNISCAALISLSPVTSGLAAWHVLCEGSFLRGRGIIGLDGDPVASFSTLPFNLILKSPLSLLVVALFFGVLSREITMDITDCEGDRTAGIETIPVKHGKKVAAGVALGCTFVAAIAACGTSLVSFYHIIIALLTDLETRKAILSVWGSTMFLWRAWRVWRTNGENADLAERAVSESLIYVVMILASFL